MSPITNAKLKKLLYTLKESNEVLVLGNPITAVTIKSYPESALLLHGNKGEKGMNAGELLKELEELHIGPQAYIKENPSAHPHGPGGTLGWIAYDYQREAYNMHLAR